MPAEGVGVRRLFWWALCAALVWWLLFALWSVIFAVAVPPAHAQQQGAIATRPQGANRPGYLWAVTGAALYATPTDWVTLCGAAGKEVHVTRVEISGTSSAAGSLDVQLIKRTAADTGGTAATETPAKFRTTMENLTATPAASATLSEYSVIPSGLGTGIAIDSGKLFTSAVGGLQVPLVWDFGRNNEPRLGIVGCRRMPRDQFQRRHIAWYDVDRFRRPLDRMVS